MNQPGTLTSLILAVSISLSGCTQEIQKVSNEVSRLIGAKDNIQYINNGCEIDYEGDFMGVMYDEDLRHELNKSLPSVSSPFGSAIYVTFCPYP